MGTTISGNRMQVGGQDVVGHGFLPSFLKEKDIEIRKAKDGVSVDDLQQASKHDGLDEIAFQTQNGDLYVAVCTDMNVKGRLGLPKAGEQVTAGDLDGTVVFSDNKINKGRLALAIAAGTVVATPLAGGAVMAATMEGANALTVLPQALVGALRGVLVEGMVATAGGATAAGVAAASKAYPEDIGALTDHVATVEAR